MFDNNHIFTEEEKEEFSRGNTTITVRDVMDFLIKMFDEQYSGRVLADDVNLYLIFVDGQAFKFTLEEIAWSEEYMKSKNQIFKSCTFKR